MAESDLERFKRQQNTVTDQSLESTRNMVTMMEESQQAGGLICSRKLTCFDVVCGHYIMC